MKSNLLEGKIVIVGGACGRLGRSFTTAILNHGGKVVMADINQKLCEEVAINIGNDLGVEAPMAAALDITSKETIDALIKSVRVTYGKIVAFVNTTYPRSPLSGGLFEETSLEKFNADVSMHLCGYFLASKEFSLLFKEQGHGNLINVSSIQGVATPRFEHYDGISIDGVAMGSSIQYSAIKHAIIAMTKYIAKYLKTPGVRCNCISPGGILDRQPQGFLDRYRKDCVSKGMLDAEDIDGTVIYLLSDLSHFVNGQNIVVDDGWLI